MGNKVHYIPTDYQDLYESYFDPSKDSFVRGLTRRYAGTGASDSDVEDLMHATFERMLRLKSLNKFDATRGNFGLYLHQIVHSVVCNWHTKNKRTPSRSSCTLEALVAATRSDKYKPHGGPLRALTGVTEDAMNPENAVIAADLEGRLFEIAQTEGGKRGAGLEKMVSILLQDGGAKDVAEALGVAASTVTGWRRFLRERLGA